MPYRLELLGEPRIQDSNGTLVDFPRGKPLALLCYLAVEKRPIDRAELGELLWPEAAQKRTRHSVRQAIWLIRRTLGEEILEGDDPVAVSGVTLSCDLLEFEGALEAGELDHARTLWRGPLLSRMSLSGCRGWDHWLEDTRSSVQRNLFQSLLSAVRSDLGLSPGEKTLTYLDEALELNPFSVEAHKLRVETFLELGQVSRASKALDEAMREVGDDTRIMEELELLGQKINVKETQGEETSPERLGESVEFVGRAGELADLRGAWKRARTGYSGVACILGPTGIGKTRLASEFLASVQRDGGVVARARGFRGENRIPWGSVSDLIQELILLPGAKGISSGSDAVLRGVVPSLSTNGHGSSPANGHGEIHSAALADAVADLIEAVGFEAPLGVFLDDWQWVDKESRALIAKVTRRVKGLPCLFLLAERTGERRLRQEGADRLVADLGGRKVVLSPLDLAELGELVALLAEFEDPTETPNLVDQLFRVTGGNPLFVGEVLRKLADDGIYQLEDGRWILKAGRLDGELDLPESVQSLIRERLERLSPTASQVASALAQERRDVSAPALRRRAGLDEAVFARAINELVDREVVSWVGPTDVDFSHDQLREAAGLTFPPPKGGGALHWLQGHTLPATLGAATLLVLAIFGGSRIEGDWLSIFGRGDSGPAPTYPYGKGRVVLGGDSLLELIPPTHEGGEWTLQSSSIWMPEPLGFKTTGPFRMPDGGIRWFAELSEKDEPPWVVELHQDGTQTMVMKTPGDVAYHDLAPSGGASLLMSQDPDPNQYRQNLVRWDEAEGTFTTLYRPEEATYGASWSPDGHRVALVVAGLVDTLLILNPVGAELDRFPLDGYRNAVQPRWCPDSRHLTMNVFTKDPGKGLLLDVETRDIVEFGNTPLATSFPLCLGTGRAVLFPAITDGEQVVVLQDLETRTVTPLHSFPLEETWLPVWLPDEVEPPLWGVHIQRETTSIEWGGNLALTALTVSTGGTETAETVVWSSSDPHVASVNPTGQVTGNRVGQAQIIATYAGWVRDSLMVSVVEREEQPERLLFREDFRGEDAGELPQWIIPEQTSPRPEVLTREGEQVLYFNGDGRHRDYMQSIEDFSLAQGATLEIEFKMEITREDQQRIYVCLQGDDLETLPVSPEELFSEKEFCITYPSMEGTKRLDNRLSISYRRAGNLFERSSPHLPSQDWIHLALQVRPDGTFSVLVNRDPVFISPEPALGYADFRWRVEVGGASTDTELLMRNITLWTGERFEILEGDLTPDTLTEPEPQSRR